MKKTKVKKPRKVSPKLKIHSSKKNFYILFWTVILFILSIPLLVFVRNQQDIRQHAAMKQTTTAATCIPSGGTCKPVGNCGTAETDAGEKDCSSDGSLTCCIPQSVGCLGGSACNPTPTTGNIAPSPVIPTDTPMFNGFVNPSTTVSNVPSQAPSNSPSQTQPAPSVSTIPSQILPSLSVTPGNGSINNNLLTELLNLIKQILDFFASLIGSIGGHHSGGNTTNHHSDKD